MSWTATAAHASEGKLCPSYGSQAFDEHDGADRLTPWHVLGDLGDVNQQVTWRDKWNAMASKRSAS
jgi:hypothetical protein